MRRKVTLKLGRGGKVQVEAFGYVGGECTAATRPYEEALGVPTGERVLKPEFYQAQTLDVGGPQVGSGGSGS